MLCDLCFWSRLHMLPAMLLFILWDCLSNMFLLNKVVTYPQACFPFSYSLSPHTCICKHTFLGCGYQKGFAYKSRMGICSPDVRYGQQQLRYLERLMVLILLQTHADMCTHLHISTKHTLQKTCRASEKNKWHCRGEGGIEEEHNRTAPPPFSPRLAGLFISSRIQS